MNKYLLPALLTLMALLGVRNIADAHCEVPCGIYGDQERFSAMLEDKKTIKKAMDQIKALASKADALSRNQLARWVSNKEIHATRIQHTIAQYFMAQRIKSKDETYVARLTAAHAVMVAAMKCKQNVDPALAEGLRGSIIAFHKVYEGKAAGGGK